MRDLSAIYRDKSLSQLQPDKKTRCHISGLCKNPLHTRGNLLYRRPLCCNNILSAVYPLAPNLFLRLYREKFLVPWLIRFVWQICYHLTTAKRPTLRQAYFIWMTNLFHLDNSFLTCTLHGLLLWLAYGNSRFCFWNLQNRFHEHHLQAGLRACKPSFVFACRDRWTLGYCSKHGQYNKLPLSVARTHS